MPVKSAFPSFELPKLDIWAFLFERKDKEYPDDKGSQHPTNTILFSLPSQH
jgi:4-coumarate--CoA ligase